MASNELPSLERIAGDEIRCSVAESLAGAAIFLLGGIGGVALFALAIISNAVWYYLVGGIVVGLMLIVAGLVGARLMIAKAFSGEHIVIGSDRLQLIQGKEAVVVGQIPYANIARIQAEKQEGGMGSGYVGVMLHDWNDPATHWPGGAEGYQMRREEGAPDIMLGTEYQKTPRQIVACIEAKRTGTES